MTHTLPRQTEDRPERTSTPAIILQIVEDMDNPTDMTEDRATSLNMVYGVNEAYLQQTPYYPAASPIPYAALLANSPAFVQGLAQLSALLTPQQTPPIESLYTIASALVSEAVQTTTATVFGPSLVSVETGGLPAAGPVIPSVLEGPLYAKPSAPEDQASQFSNYSNIATSIPTSQVTSTPLQTGGGSSDPLLARLSDPVTARLLQSISPFLSQIPSTNMASTQPTESTASASPAASQPVQSYPGPQSLHSKSGESSKDSARSSSQPTNTTSVSAVSFGSGENGLDPSQGPTSITEPLDRAQLDLKSEKGMSIEVVRPTLDDAKIILEQPATITTSGDHEGTLTHKREQLETDFVAIKAERDNEPRITSAQDATASMDVIQGSEHSGVDILTKREPSTEPCSTSLESSGFHPTETGPSGPEVVGETKDFYTPANAAKAETMECASSGLDEPGQITLPAVESTEASEIDSAESKTASSIAVEGALEQNNVVPQKLDQLKEPISLHSAHEDKDTMDSGMELDHAMDDMAVGTSEERPNAKGATDPKSGYALASTDMDLEELPTVPDVENSSPGPTFSSLTDVSPASDNDSSSHSESQPPLLPSSSKTTASAHPPAQNGTPVYPSWHHVPGADMALLSEMRASTADLSRFRRETRWLEERVRRPRRDAVSEDVFDKALGLTRTISLSRQKRDHRDESQHQKQGQDQDQDQDRSYPQSQEHAQRTGQSMTTRSFGAAVRLSADSRLAYSSFKAHLMEEMEEQLRLESEQRALQRAVERTETKIKLKQRLGEQAEQKMREVLEKQAELDLELERVRKMEQEYLEKREQQRRKAEDEIRQLEETLRMLQEHHQQQQQQQQQQHHLQPQPLQQQAPPPSEATTAGS
ncbi:hypothetical protein EC968_001451 [Mortierella alpina]|nr:hypothetical protein EC968_001451 [Mortierella alpina]